MTEPASNPHPDGRSLAEVYGTPDTWAGGSDLVQGTSDTREALELLHQQIRPTAYLEIGVRKGLSLRLANCEAVGVDPDPSIAVDLGATTRVVKMASDDFFGSASDPILERRPELVFIDGMHLVEYALRDFMNVEEIARPGTVVVIDDVLPNHSSQATRTRQTSIWAGDVWKIHSILEQHRPDLRLTLVDTSPTGMLIVTGLDPDNRTLRQNYNSIVDMAMRNTDVPDTVVARTDAVAIAALDLDDLISKPNSVAGPRAYRVQESTDDDAIFRMRSGLTETAVLEPTSMISGWVIFAQQEPRKTTTTVIAKADTGAGDDQVTRTSTLLRTPALGRRFPNRPGADAARFEIPLDELCGSTIESGKNFSIGLYRDPSSTTPFATWRFSLDPAGDASRVTASSPMASANRIVESVRGRPFAVDLSTEALTKVHRGIARTSYKGRRFPKSPFDLVLYLRVIEELQPRTIIEIGTSEAGSAIWFRDQCVALGLDAQVITIDLERPEVDVDGVCCVEGDAMDPAGTFPHELLASAPHPWLISEDSAHTFEATSAVLAYFDPLTVKGDIIAVEDGIVADLPQFAARQDGPNRAVADFLDRVGDRYEIRADLCDYFGYNVTYNPNGWLERSPR